MHIIGEVNSLTTWFAILAYSGITVGLQQTSYNTLETGGPLSICAQMFVGDLEKNVSLTLASTDGSAKGMSRPYHTSVFFIEGKVLIISLLA